MNSNANRQDKVVHLRGLLKDRFPEAHRQPVSPPPSPEIATPPPSFAEVQAPPASTTEPAFPLGVRFFDTLDGGRGLPPGTLAEIVCRRQGGGVGVLLAGLVQAAATSERRYPLALVDGADSFDARVLGDSPETAGVLCRHLLWVRCRHRIDHALQVTDLLLRDGNLPLVLLDLQLCRPAEVRRGIPGGNSTWYRLRTLGEKTGTTLLTFTAEPVVPSAPWRLELDQAWPLEALDRLPHTGDLRREAIRHTIRRARPATTASDSPGETGANGAAGGTARPSYAIAS